MSRPTQGTATVDGASRKGLSPAAAALSSAFRSPHLPDIAALQPRPGRNRGGLGSSPFARRYWGNHCYFLFLRVLRCFSSPRWPPDFARMAGLQPAGFSHSDTGGSTAVCASPPLFAAYRVLPRLREPRHPPYALICFAPLHAQPVRAGWPCRKRAWLMRRPSTGGCLCFLRRRFLAPLFGDGKRRSSVFVSSDRSIVHHVMDRFRRLRRMVENNGFEPLTLCLQSRCSSQLS